MIKKYKPVESRTITLSESFIRRELFRKYLHMTVALIPGLANIHFLFTVLLLTAGILVYITNESARIAGQSHGILSGITEFASRPTEPGFVWGPVTMGLGALTALLYYPDPAATVGIYALAFGDSAACLAGILLRRKSLIAKRKKTYYGSGACFLTVLLASYLVLQNFWISFFSAVAATVLEYCSSEDLDNLLIPVGTGLIVYIFI